MEVPFMRHPMLPEQPKLWRHLKAAAAKAEEEAPSACQVAATRPVIGNLRGLVFGHAATAA